MRWKIKEVRFYFGYLHLSCLSDLKELVLGVGFSSSKYPTPLLQIFYLTPTLCWPGKRAGDEQKIIFFFQSVDLVIFKQIL